jgi:hypothetical protein
LLQNSNCNIDIKLYNIGGLIANTYIHSETCHTLEVLENNVKEILRSFYNSHYDGGLIVVNFVSL